MEVTARTDKTVLLLELPGASRQGVGSETDELEEKLENHLLGL